MFGGKKIRFFEQWQAKGRTKKTQRISQLWRLNQKRFGRSNVVTASHSVACTFSRENMKWDFGQLDPWIWAPLQYYNTALRAESHPPPWTTTATPTPTATFSFFVVLQCEANKMAAAPLVFSLLSMHKQASDSLTQTPPPPHAKLCSHGIVVKPTVAI